MEIVVTDFAKKQLLAIHDYYALEASLKIADDTVETIIDKIETLIDFPQLGTSERYLLNLKLGHRCLVSGNYKIIYRIKRDIIYITDVFDARQHPSLLTKRNKAK